MASFSEERRKDTTESPTALFFWRGKRPSFIMNNMPLRLINLLDVQVSLEYLYFHPTVMALIERNNV